MANARDVTLDLIGRDKTAAATRSAGRNFDKLERKIDAANRKVQRKTGLMSKAFGALGAAKGGPVALAAVGLGAFALAAVKSSAMAEQSIGGVQAVFKGYFRLVEKQSERAADKYGISAQAYQDSAALIGASLKNQGVALWKLSGLTDKYIKRGADLAATYGGTASEAVEAFTSALKGEFDPLERYGISIKQSILNTEAFRIAKVKTAAEWDKLPSKIKKAATQQGLWNLVQKQSADAEGQANRERGTTMSKWQRFTALLTDLRTQITAVFLPAVNAGLDRMITWVKWMGSHKKEAAEFFVNLAVKAMGAFQQILAGLKGLVQSTMAGLITIAEAWNDSPLSGKHKIDTSKLKAYSASFGASVDGWIGKLDIYKAAVKKLPTITKLKGDVKDLETKIARAKAKLHTVPKEKQAKLKADIASWTKQLNAAKAQLDAIHSKTIILTLRKNMPYTPPTNPHGDGKSSAGDTWQGSAPGGRYRIEAPRVVLGNTYNDTRVFLDSREIRSVARTAVMDETRRAGSRARVGRR